MNPKHLGIIIASVSIMIIAILVYAQIEINQFLKVSCEQVHGPDYTSICPYHKSMNFAWIPIAASVMIGALGGIGLYLAFAKDVKFVEQKEYDLSKLSDEEKKFFYRIQQDKAGVYQSALVNEFGMSKVHVTRLLDSLEGRGLVERKRRGLTNIVVVK